MQGPLSKYCPKWLGLAGMALAGLMGARIVGQDFGNQLIRFTGTPDPACGMNYCDAALFWVAGRLSRAGDITTIYNAKSFMSAAAHMLPEQRQYLPFVYPPPILLPASLLSLTGLKSAYFIATVALTGASCWLFRQASLGWLVVILGLLSPAGLWAIYLGQFGVIGSALLLTGLSGLPTRPAQTGALLSLLCCKPQYALLVPVIFVAGRHWRALGSFVGGIAVIIAVSYLWPGPQAWQSFAVAGRAAEQALLQAPFGPGYEFHGTSVFWMSRSLGANLPLAYTVQTITALLAAVAAWRLWQHEDASRLPLTLCLMLLVTPYGFTDDMVGYSIAAAMLLRRGAPLRNATLAALWVAPGFTGHLASISGVLITPLLALLMMAIGWLTPASQATDGLPTEPVQSE
jgi:hypothetical protein